MSSNNVKPASSDSPTSQVSPASPASPASPTSTADTSSNTGSKLRIGIVGGGQLGALFYREAMRYAGKAADFSCLSETEPVRLDGSCPPIYWIKVDANLEPVVKTNHVLIRCLDVLVLEREDVSIKALRRLRADNLRFRGEDLRIIPDPDILEIIQNKANQKSWLTQHGFPTSTVLLRYDIEEELREWLSKLGQSMQEKCVVNKLQKGGYDGRGVQVIRFEPGADPLDKLHEFFEAPGLIEEHVKIVREYSVITCRDRSGHQFTFCPSELVMDPESHVLDYLIYPPENYPTILQCLARDIARKMDLEGLLAIEFFLTDDERILVNEMSPRPHNSGHQTIEKVLYGNQYVQLFECCIGQRLTPLTLRTDRHCLMMNLLAEADTRNYEVRKTCFWQDRFKLTLYGKQTAHKGRKMGHIVYLNRGPTEDPHMIAEQLRLAVRQSGSNSKTSAKSEPIVGVIMGSSSDLPTVQPALDLLADFDVPHEVRIVSAHRDPAGMLAYATEAEKRGLKVIIAAAGGAAHLPGMVASGTILPVIGIPVRSHNSIQGIDSLLSIVQMPAGIPVATMSINGAKNAALMAIRILATSSISPSAAIPGAATPRATPCTATLSTKLHIYEKTLREKVREMNLQKEK